MAEPQSAAHVLVIAEAGVNHNGDLGRAREMVAVAAAAGADVVKFQTFDASELATAAAPKASYQQQNDTDSAGQIDMLARLELDWAAHQELKLECDRLEIEFLSTPFGETSLTRLLKLGMNRIKIPSGEITNLPYLRSVAGRARPVILSTGMSTLTEVRQAVDVLRSGNERIDLTLLQCNSAYPTPVSDTNLRVMPELARQFDCAVGLSDHSAGINVSLAAAALGATVVEKHFTLDRSLPGPDHRASLEPDELAALVRGIREVTRALGSAQKRVSTSEAENRMIARRSIVAGRRIEAGEVLTEDALTTKRPGSGLSPMEWDRVVGAKAPRAFDPDEQIEI